MARKPGVMVLCAIPLMILCIFELVQLYLFGGGNVSGNMFTNVFTTNSTEATELLRYIYIPILAGIVIYLPLIIMAIRSIRCSEATSAAVREKWRIVGMCCIIVGGVIASIARIELGISATRRYIFPANVTMNIATSLHEIDLTDDYLIHTHDYLFHPKRDSLRPDSQRNVFVLVIGEASRAANWSAYGYRRKTTPHLDTLHGIVFCRDMITQSNVTHKSVPLLLSDTDARDYRKLFHSKSILALFREAGFFTAFLSNQRPNRNIIQNFASEAEITRYLPSGSFDEALIPLLDSILSANNRDLFVVIHCYGSHFDYGKRYPESFEVYRPTACSILDKSLGNQWINRYDNSILYTDHVLSRMIETLNRPQYRAAMIFCSDHGEDLFDYDTNRFLHASPHLTAYQLHIPCFFWLSESYRRSCPSKYQALTRNAAKPVSTCNIFHSMGHLAGITAAHVDTTKSLLNPTYRIRTRYVLDEQEMRAIPLHLLRLEPVDRQVLHNYGIKLE